jgi:hypothetical protein
VFTPEVSGVGVRDTASNSTHVLRASTHTNSFPSRPSSPPTNSYNKSATKNTKVETQTNTKPSLAPLTGEIAHPNKSQSPSKASQPPLPSLASPPATTTPTSDVPLVSNAFLPPALPTPYFVQQKQKLRHKSNHAKGTHSLFLPRRDLPPRRPMPLPLKSSPLCTRIHIRQCAATQLQQNNDDPSELGKA